MIIFLMFGVCSGLAGVGDMLLFGGAYAEQSPMFPIFDAFGVAPATEVGTMPLPSFREPIGAIGTVWNALTWEYSVLKYNLFGQVVRWMIFWPMSAGMALAFALTLWQSIPIIGRGSS